MLDVVPDDWRRAALSDLVKIVTAGISADELALKSEVHHYSLPAFDFGGGPEIGPGAAIKSNKTLVPRDCVLFSKLNPRIPRIWRVDGIASPDSYCSTEFWPLVQRSGGIDLDFLAHFLGSPAFLGDPAIVPSSSTNSHQRVDRRSFEAFVLTLPPLDEQQRIAEVLRSVDQHLSLTSQALVAAQSAKDATLIDALGRDWPNTTIGELLAGTGHPMRSGPFGSALLKSELVAEGVPFLGIDNVQVERFVPTYKRFISQEKYVELARYTVFPGDVMVTIMGTVGRCCVVPPDIGTAISSKHVWTLTLNAERYSPHLLAWQINHAPWVLEQLIGSAQGGIMSAISSGTLRGLVVPLPPPAELCEVEQLLLSCNSAISSLEAELESAEAMKAALTDDLLSGRVRVPA